MVLAFVHPRAENRPGWLALQQSLAEHGVEVVSHLSRWAGHTRELAREHLPPEGIALAVGGDGTFHELVNGWLDQEAPGRPRFLPIPHGTGNDFIRSVWPGREEQLVKAIVDPRERDFDLGKITYQTPQGRRTRYFLVGATVGFSASVTEFMSKLPRILPGTPLYLFSLVVSLLTWVNRRARFSVDSDEIESHRFFNLNVANVRHYGGGMVSAPAAVADDGQLDPVLMELTKLGVIRAMPENYRGRFERVSGVRQFRCSRLALQSPFRLPVQADGEFLGSTPIEVEILPGALPGLEVP